MSMPRHGFGKHMVAALTTNGDGRFRENSQPILTCRKHKGDGYHLHMAVKKTTKTKMTPEHKKALAEGREQGRAVRAYLEALEANKPRRGRRRTPESIERRLATIESQLDSADPLKKVQLVQERMNLQQELAAGSATVDIGALEKDFVANAASYSSRKGISYAAWRELGVPATVLRSAGISRAS